MTTGASRRLWAIAVLVGAATMTRSVGAQNFSGGDPALLAAAEQARRDSAIFWTGRELPGRWATPCPIVVSNADARDRQSGSGKTTFQIAEGEVFGWRMTVAGSREEILSDVIPHEVDHMVRASLVRRSIPRWLDEGCAALRESRASQERLRSIVSQQRDFTLTETFLNAREYPADPQQLSQVYGVGFSLVEFLLEREGPETLLQLQTQNGNLTAGLQELYRLSPAALDDAWKAWFHARHAATESSESTARDVRRRFTCDCRQPPPNLLTIYSASWCGPCRRFWRDLETNTNFRLALLSRFHLHWVDCDRDWRPPNSGPLRALPTFVHGEGRIEGYEGPDWLLAQLSGLSVTDDPEVTDAPPAAPPAVLPPPDPPVDSAVNAEDPVEKPSPGQAALRAAARTAPIVLTALQMLGLIGGTVATGGLGGAAIAVLAARVGARRAAGRSPVRTGKEAERLVTVRAPFPRYLDETRELLELRQTEGRVAALDALRGMFLDDEAAKVMADGDASTQAAVRRLLGAIDERVGDVAPLATKADVL